MQTLPTPLHSGLLPIAFHFLPTGICLDNAIVTVFTMVQDDTYALMHIYVC